MIDLQYRGANDLEVIIHRLRNYADYLEERIKDLEQEIKELKSKLKDQIKSDN